MVEFPYNHPLGGAYSFDNGQELIIIGRPSRLDLSTYVQGEVTGDILGWHRLRHKLAEITQYGAQRHRLIDAYQDLVAQASVTLRNFDHMVQALAFKVGFGLVAYIIEKEPPSNDGGGIGTIEGLSLERVTAGVAEMSASEKFVEVLKRTPSHLPSAMAEEFRQLLAPASIAIMVASLIAMAAITATGVGAGIILAVGVIFIGWSIFSAARSLIEFFKVFNHADSEQDLDLAAEHFARFVSELTVGALVAFLTKGASRAAQKGGAAVRRNVLEAQQSSRTRQWETSNPTITDAQRRVAQENGMSPYYVDERGRFRYPEVDGGPQWKKDGFLVKPTSQTLQPGTMIDRYTPKSPLEDTGKYFSPEGLPFEQRSLPLSQQQGGPHLFEVVKPFEVKAGPAAPWFGAPGGGTQYQSALSTQQLLLGGYIKPIVP